MEAEFWLQRWRNNQIGFHLSEPNPHLLDHFPALALAEKHRIFLPLCGKTLDIGWLAWQGYQVVGIELSEFAIQQLFNELNIAKPVVKEIKADILSYSHENIEIFVGDIFQLTATMLRKVDAVYDRAALVALPTSMRKQYVNHISQISHTVPQLLVSIEYDQTIMSGPPFSVIADEIHTLYSDHYHIELLKTSDMPGGLKGKCVALEKVWLLKALQN